MTHQHTILSEKELPLLAEKLIGYIQEQNQTVVLFYGTMGAGKTTFITQICKKLGIQDTISSPTFALINEYFDKQNQSVYHFDFYRLNKPEEAFDIGAEEFFYSGNLCLIEWPEKVEPVLPDNYIKVHIKALNNHTRQISWTTLSRH